MSLSCKLGHFETVKWINFINELDPHILNISLYIQFHLVVIEKFGSNCMETKQLAEMENAAILKWSFDMRLWWTLHFSLLILTRITVLKSLKFITWLWSHKNQPKYKQMFFETNHSILSISIRMLYFTRLHLCSTWNANQIHLKIHLGL